MSPLVELITAWDKYTGTNPQNSTVIAFCEHYLYDSPRAGKRKDGTSTFALARRLGRVASIQRTCIRLALKDIPDIEPEWYYFLHSINELEPIPKTEIISLNVLLEPTTGIDILNRMIKAGLLSETQNEEDRRVRLIELTQKGKATFKKADRLVRQVADLLFSRNLPLWTTLNDYLSMVEWQFGPLLSRHRPKTLEELITLVEAPPDEPPRGLI